MRKVTTLQDVHLHENWFPVGTGFVVVEAPKPDVKPPEVDPRTADAWINNGWAEDGDGKKASKPNAG